MLNSFYSIDKVDLNELNAYQLYNSIKLHFNQKSYDFFKYGANEKRFNLESFSKRPDKDFFTRISNKVLYKDRYIPILISSFYHDKKTWVGTLLERPTIERALDFRKYSNDIQKHFIDDIKKLVYNTNIISAKELHGQNTKTNYFTMLSMKKIHPITGCILNNLYYEKYMSNTALSFVYDEKSLTLNKLYQFLPKEFTNGISEELINDAINQIH